MSNAVVRKSAPSPGCILKLPDVNYFRRDFTEGGRKFKTALMLASERGMVTVIRKLLDRGADCSLTDEEGATSLMLAVTGAIDAQHASSSGDIRKKESTGVETVNFEAAVGLLVEPTSQAGALDAKTSSGSTALMIASFWGMVTEEEEEEEEEEGLFKANAVESRNTGLRYKIE